MIIRDYYLKQIIEEIKTLGVNKENIIYINLDSFQNNDLLEVDKLYSYINSEINNWIFIKWTKMPFTAKVFTLLLNYNCVWGKI